MKKQSLFFVLGIVLIGTVLRSPFTALPTILGNIAQFVKGGGLFAVCVVLFLLPIIYNVIMPKKKEA